MLACYSMHNVDFCCVLCSQPLVRRDATDVCAQLRVIPGIDSVSLTSNGIVLKRKLPAGKILKTTPRWCLVWSLLLAEMMML